MMDEILKDPNSQIMKQIDLLIASGAYPGIAEPSKAEPETVAKARRALLAEVIFGTMSHGRVGPEFANLGYDMSTPEGKEVLKKKLEFYRKVAAERSPEKTYVRILEDRLAKAKPEQKAAVQKDLDEARRKLKELEKNHPDRLADNPDANFMFWLDPERVAKLTPEQKKAVERFGWSVAEGERLLNGADANRERGPLLTGAGNTQIVNTAEGTMMVVTDQATGKRIYVAVNSAFQTGESNVLPGAIAPDNHWVMPVVRENIPDPKERERQANSVAFIAVDTYKNMKRVVPGLNDTLQVEVKEANPEFHDALARALKTEVDKLNASRKQQGLPGNLTFQLVSANPDLAGKGPQDSPIARIPTTFNTIKVEPVSAVEVTRNQDPNSKPLNEVEQNVAFAQLKMSGFGVPSEKPGPEFLKGAVHMEAKPGEIIVAAGSAPGQVYFVTDGTILIQHAGTGAAPIRLTATAQHPIPIGEISAISGMPRNATVTVDPQGSPVKMIAVPKETTSGWKLSDLAIQNDQVTDVVGRLYGQNSQPGP
jgi:hypothetical protein